MTINIGNLPPKTSITITFEYIEMLSVCLNKFWKFSLPSTLTPRYQPKEQNNKNF